MVNYKYPPVIKSPRWWQLINWIFRPVEYLEELAEKYGDIFTLRLDESSPIIFVSNPQGVKEVFRNDGQLFDLGSFNNIVKPFLGDNSIFVLDNQPHQRHRKLLMPSFHGDKVKSYAQLICQITEKVMGQLTEKKVFVALQITKEISLDVIIKAVLGLTQGDHYEKIKIMLRNYLEMINYPLGSSMAFFKFLQQDWGNWSPWGRVMAQKQDIYNLLETEINRRRQQKEISGNDILSLIMSARDENGEMMNNDELCDEIITLVVVGYQTISITITWALYWIHQLPEIKVNLLEELKSLKDDSDLMAIFRLPYLTAVCQETLRFYPTVIIGLTRMTKYPLEFMGYSLPENIQIIPCPYLTHHRKDIYQRPQEFKPERFLESQFSAYEYFPFGGGNRYCIGSALVNLQMKLVLGTILTNYDLTLAPQRNIKPQRRGLTIAPNTGVKMILEKKRSLI